MSSIQRSNDMAKTILTSVGSAISNNTSVCLMLLTATVLLIASICVPYYKTSAGVTGAVYGNGKDCLGFTDVNCDTVHALPVVTLLLGFMTLLCMGAHVSSPFLSNVPGFNLTGRKLDQIFSGFGITVPVLLLLTAIFSVSTLATQLALPVSGSSSLADEAKNSSSSLTFTDGMALSAASTALFVFVFLTNTELIGKMASFFKY